MSNSCYEIHGKIPVTDPFLLKFQATEKHLIIAVLLGKLRSSLENFFFKNNCEQLILYLNICFRTQVTHVLCSGQIKFLKKVSCASVSFSEHGTTPLNLFLIFEVMK